MREVEQRREQLPRVGEGVAARGARYIKSLTFRSTPAPVPLPQGEEGTLRWANSKKLLMAREEGRDRGRLAGPARRPRPGYFLVLSPNRV